jgi:hypothetical protein
MQARKFSAASHKVLALENYDLSKTQYRQKKHYCGGLISDCSFVLKCDIARISRHIIGALSSLKAHVMAQSQAPVQVNHAVV